MRVPLIAQTGATDCGAAALAMVFAARGVAVPVERVRAELDAGRDGVSVRDLKLTAAEHGLTGRAFDLPDLREDLPRLRGLPVPFIAHWEHDHFLVVERIARRTVRLADPAVGRRRLGHAEAARAFTGVALLFEVAPGRRRAVPTRPPMLVPALREYRWLLAGVLLVSLALTAIGAVVPAATAVLVDSLARRAAPGPSWIAATAALAAGTAALSWLRAVATSWLQLRLGRHLAAQAVRRLLDAAYRYFERRSQGDLLNRLAAATGIRDLLAGALIGIALDAVFAVGYLVVLAVLAPVVAVGAGLLAVVQLGLVGVLSARSRSLQREELLAQGQEATQLLDAVAGIAAIRSAGAENVVYDRWVALYEQSSRAARRRSLMSAASDAVSGAVRIAAPLLLLYLAATSPATSATSPGTAVGLATIAGIAVASVGALTARLFDLGELGPLADRLADVLNAPAEQPGTLPQAPPLLGAVTLDDVSYRYDRRSPYALRGLTVHIRPGMKVAVVGASGSGKSTLTKLLTGLHPPTTGRVRFDGRDLAGLDRRSVRRQLGVVLQEPFLGSGTVRDAIALGRPAATDAEVERVARLAVIHDDITAFPMGYRTRVGDGGTGLSGGQRQRIALARALLTAPAVLILDEATSALDAVTEAAVEANLARLALTRIVIAHRLSTVADADLVLVLHGGVVVEQGRPGELREYGGRYADLVRAQAG